MILLIMTKSQKIKIKQERRKAMELTKTEQLILKAIRERQRKL